MKIAFCAPADLLWLARATGHDSSEVTPGLGSTATTPLLLELLARGHEIELFTLCNKLTQETSYSWGSLKVYVGPSREWGAARTFYAQEIRYLRRKLQEVQPEFVHAHWTYEFALASLFAKRKTLVTIHDLPWNVLRFFRDRARFVRLMMAYGVALQARHYTAVSDDAARHFRRYLRPAAKIASIPNFVPDVVLKRANQSRVHPRRPLVFATVLQGWTRRKNPKAALRAFAEYRVKSPGAQLLMIGTDYQEGGPAAQWARENSLEADVVFAGPQPYETMLDRMAGSVDALVSPSMDEALSLTVLESMALGIPVIAGRSTPGMQQELDGGKAGLLVDVRAPGEICGAMQELQQNCDLYETLSARGYARARTAFTAKSVVTAYEAQYADMLNRGLGTIQESSVSADMHGADQDFAQGRSFVESSIPEKGTRR